MGVAVRGTIEELEAAIATQHFPCFFTEVRTYRVSLGYEFDERARFQKCYATMNESEQRERASSMPVRKPSGSPPDRKRSARL